MLEQILNRFDEKMRAMVKLWGEYRDSFDTDGRTFIFADVCADALKASQAFGFTGDDQQALKHALREYVWRCSRFIDTDEAMSAIDQLADGVDLLRIQWKTSSEPLSTGTEVYL
jgi:hypothetical protein